MSTPSPYLPTVQAFFDQEAIAQTVENKTVGMPQTTVQQDNSSPLVAGGSFALGFIALWAVATKLLERFGNSAIDVRQQKITQELAQERNISDFYLKEANRDSETINTTLNTFVTKHLDSTTQLFDLYYNLVDEYKKLAEQDRIKSERLASMEIVLKDILVVLQMKERSRKEQDL